MPVLESLLKLILGADALPAAKTPEVRVTTPPVMVAKEPTLPVTVAPEI